MVHGYQHPRHRPKTHASETAPKRDLVFIFDKVVTFCFHFNPVVTIEVVTDSKAMKTATFTENKLATTVGANGIATDAVVTQPALKIRVNEEVEYEFDQQKYEEYLSSSSSRSASPSRRKKASSSRVVRGTFGSKTQDPLAIAALAPRGDSALPNVVKIADLGSSPKKVATEGAPAISKRALQRRRQRLARQMAKALEPMDGVRYSEDLKARQRQEQQRYITSPSSQAGTNKWVRVTRNRSTLEERIRKRRALLAHARALLKKAEEMQKEEAVKTPPKLKQTWVLKANPTPKTKVKEVAAQPSPRPNPVPLTPAPPVGSGMNTDPSTSKVPVKGRLGPLPGNRGKVPIKERLGPLKGHQVSNQTGGRINPPTKDEKGKAPITDRIGLRVEIQEPVQFLCSQKRKLERATFEKTNKTSHAKGEAHSSEDDGVLPRSTCQHSIGCSSYQADELYYRAGGMGKSRKKYVQDMESRCPCANIIKAVLSECSCAQTPRRISVFDRISTGTSEAKPRRFQRRRRMVKDGEFPKVTINMASRGASTRRGDVYISAFITCSLLALVLALGVNTKKS